MNKNRILENEIKSKNKKQIDNKTIIYYEKQLNESNNTIKRMGEMIKELENQIEELQKEIETHSNMNKEEEIKNYITQLELLSEEKNKLYEDNTKMYNDIDQLQNHISLLTDQNKKLAARLNENKIIDSKIKNSIIIEDTKSNDELSD